jgi:phytoene desaturase
MGRVAVIGAGMGAMAAAARLAVAGHRVTVYERTDTYGGALRRRERDGFAFDTGPGLLPLPAVYRDLFVKTGRRPLEECVDLVQTDPSARHVFPDGTRVDLPNASRAGVVAALEESVGPGAGQRWGDFLVRGREAWDRTRRPLLEEPLWPNRDVLAGREPYPSVAHRRLLRTRRAATLAQVGEWELGDPRLARLLESHALAYGLDPRTAPASVAVLPYMEHAFGVWYVRGGLRELARAVYERCLERRVEFRFGASAVRVVEKDGRAAGVELDDGTLAEADHVVVGVRPDLVAGPHGTAAEAGNGPASRPHGGTAAVRGPAPSPVSPASVPGRLTLLLALRGSREADAVHRTVVHSPDRDAELDALTGALPAEARAAVVPTVTVLRPDDPALRPDDGHESVVLTATVPAGTDAREAERRAELMLTAARAAVPGLRERLLWHEVRTPEDTVRETGAAGVPAPALAGGGAALLRPGNATGLPDLYRAGGWSHPGGGLPHAGMSGALVTGLIVEGPDFRGSV